MSNDGSKTYTIQVNHVTRVEGHGSIKVSTRNGEVEELKLSIVEAHRFFESFTQGMLPHEIPWIVGRICGICCVGHQLAASKAVEAALGLAVSAQSLRLRKLLNESQILQSHLLHVYFLAVPDYVGVPSVLPLIKTHPEVVKRALKLKHLANEFTTVIGGRALHPMANTLRGWRKLPDLDALEGIRDRLLAALPDLDATVGIVTSLKMPDFERETEYVSLKHPDEYALYDGDVYSSDTGKTAPVRDYLSITNEFTVPHSTAKWARWHRESYMVGALARVNNNYNRRHARPVRPLLQPLHEQRGAGGGNRPLRAQQSGDVGADIERGAGEGRYQLYTRSRPGCRRHRSAPWAAVSRAPFR